MRENSDSNAAEMNRLKSWVKSNVNVSSYLKKPASFEGMVGTDQTRAKYEDRTKAAAKMMDKYLGKNDEFTEIMTQLGDIKTRDGREVLCSRLREIILETQDLDWGRYMHPSNSRNRQMAGA